MHFFVIDDRSIEIINKTRYFQWSVNKAGIKKKIISICLNDFFAKVYNAVICRIHTLLYGIYLNTKLLKAIGYRQDKICKDNICKAK